jgi:hypothetical protein
VKTACDRSQRHLDNNNQQRGTAGIGQGDWVSVNAVEDRNAADISRTKHRSPRRIFVCLSPSVV